MIPESNVVIFFHYQCLILQLIIWGHVDLVFLYSEVVRRKLDVNLNKPKDTKINDFFKLINEDSAISKAIKKEKLCSNKLCVLGRSLSKKQEIPFLQEIY